MFKKIKDLKQVLFLIIISIVTVILRLYRLNDLFHFTYDESVFAFIGKRIIVNHHIPLIGGVTPFHVHLSPFFYWLSAVFLFFSKLNPLGWGVFSAIISGFTIMVLYFFVKEAYSTRIAIIASILYSFSLYTNIFDRHYWGLFFNPLISILVLYSLFKISKRKYSFFLLLGAVLGFGFHTDPSTIIFFPLIFLVVWLYKIPLMKNRYVKIGLLIFLLSFLPLIIFDLRHNFVNIKGIFQYIPEISGSSGISLMRISDSILYIPRLLSRIILITGKINLAEEYSYCPKYAFGKLTNIPLILLLISGIILIIAVFNKTISKKEKTTKTILNIFLLSTLLGLFIYSGLLGRPFFEHYLSTLIPVLIIFIALVLDKIISVSKIFGVLIIAVFIFINLKQLLNVYYGYGFNIESEAVKWTIANTEGDFALDSLSSCFRYNGYRYLFYLYGKEPTKSYVDQNFFWLYDKPPSQIHPKELIVMVAADYKDNTDLRSKYLLYKQREIKSKTFGDLEAIIVDNTKGILYEF